MTGESVPVDKSIAPVAAAAPLGDRVSTAFSGTMVASGNAGGVAVATGSASQLGRISTLVGTIETLTTPLLRQMNRLSRTLTALILVGSASLFAFAVLVRGYHWQEAFMVMIGLAVAAIPEGLPAVMTITLAIGVQRMAARNAIVRRLPAVETLGSVSVICSDKTGTLTRNEMTVRSVLTAEGQFEVSGAGYRPEGAFELNGVVVDPAHHPALGELTRAAILCNDAELRESGGAWAVHGDPMEGALVSLGLKAGYDQELLRKQLPRTDEIPFDTQHQFMATLHHSHEHGTAFAYIKGAPERLLTMCSRQRELLGEEPLDRAFWREATDATARQGRRMLAVAMKPLPKGRRDLNFSDVEHGATLLGLLGLIDPPREEVLAAIRECHEAGIGVKMITGDHAATAEAIARELKLAPDPKTITGQALDQLDDASLRKVVREVTVFARTSPMHKLRLVRALQVDDAVTAMTGDGVNDAPALKRADIGVAMGGKGTEAAKEAAELVLADDNFASIVAAVREGRTVYDNLRKVIEWTLPTNGGEASAIVGAIVLGLTLPVTAIQNSLDQSDHRGDARACACLRADRAGDDATATAQPGRAAAHTAPAMARRLRVGPLRDGCLRYLFLCDRPQLFGRACPHHGGQHHRGDGDLLPVQRAVYPRLVVHLAGRSRHAGSTDLGVRGGDHAVRLHLHPFHAGGVQDRVGLGSRRSPDPRNRSCGPNRGGGGEAAHGNSVAKANLESTSGT